MWPVCLHGNHFIDYNKLTCVFQDLQIKNTLSNTPLLTNPLPSTAALSPLSKLHKHISPFLGLCSRTQLRVFILKHLIPRFCKKVHLKANKQMQPRWPLQQLEVEKWLQLLACFLSSLGCRVLNPARPTYRRYTPTAEFQAGANSHIRSSLC